MKVWEKDVQNKISTLWLGENPNLIAEYKMEDTSEWITIGNMDSIGDKMYTISHTFDTLGKYLIRVRDTNTNVSIFDKLEIRDNENIEEFIKDTNYKISGLLKRWIKRGL